MKNYKIGQKVWKIEINKLQNEPAPYSSIKNGVFIEETSILGMSKYKIVLNNEWFTTLDNDNIEGYRKDRKYNIYLDDTSVNIRTNSAFLPSGVFITLYSLKEPNKKILDKMIAQASVEIKKEYAFLGNVVSELYNLTDGYGVE